MNQDRAGSTSVAAMFFYSPVPIGVGSAAQPTGASRRRPKCDRKVPAHFGWVPAKKEKNLDVLGQ